MKQHRYSWMDPLKRRRLLRLLAVGCVVFAAHGARAETLAEAKRLLLDGDFAGGIAIYERLLAADDAAVHPEALEYLGVAREKLGQSAQALSVYERFLRTYPDHAGADRVQQRFAALQAKLEEAQSPSLPPRVADQVAGIERPRTSPEQKPRRSARSWFGGFSQDLWVDSFQADGVDNAVERTALLSYANLGYAVNTDRLDIRARLDAGYLNALSGDDGRDLDQAQVHRALLSVQDAPTGVSLDLGRQNLFQDGILGRFDGLRAGWQFRERSSLYVTAGLPVDTPRYTGDTRRPFLGFSAAQEGLFDQLDLRAFGVIRQMEGQSDREAVGGEVRWYRDRWQIVANLDYDLSFQTLNSVFVHGHLNLTDQLRVFARAQSYALPFIATGNALIGQPFGELDELGEAQDLSAAQLRTLGRARTSDVWLASGGFSWNLSQRWSATGAVTYTDTDGSLDTGGIGARPRRQEFLSRLNLIGASVFRPSDTFVVGYQLHSSTVADNSRLRFELRFPFGRPFGGALRISPLLNLGYRDAVAAGDRQVLVEPGLRMTFRYRKRYRLDFLGRGRWVNRELPFAVRDTGLYEDDELRSSAYFLQVGWRIDL